MDPLAGTPWSAPETVDGFVKGEPNRVLIAYADHLRGGRRGLRALDVGCGAGRNALPLAATGWRVLGSDLSLSMLTAARARAIAQGVTAAFDVVLAPMDALPARDRSVDLIVAHGIWNLARSTREFHGAVAEAARVARAGAALFVFTFSRHTLPDDASAVEGEPFVFTQFSGRPQTFLTSDQLFAELQDAGFVADAAVPLSEYNRPASSTLRAVGGGPVIYEAAFRFCGATD